jgi:hypothetical protein
MANRPEDPELILNLGLNSEEGVSLKTLLRRAFKRLKVAHSGQRKLDYMVNLRFVSDATIKARDGNFVLVAKIPSTSQGDLVGYPTPAGAGPSGATNSSTLPSQHVEPIAPGPNPSVDVDVQRSGVDEAPMDVLGKALSSALDVLSQGLDKSYANAANDDTPARPGRVADGTDGIATVAQSTGLPDGDENRERQLAEVRAVEKVGGAGSGSAALEQSNPPPLPHASSLSLGAALEYILSDAGDLAAGTGRTGAFDAGNPIARSLSSGAHASGEGLSALVSARTVERFEPADPSELPVTETLEGVRRSASFVGEVAQVMQESSDLVANMAALERATGLDSRAARSFIGSKEPPFEIEVDGTPVNFESQDVRNSLNKEGKVSVVLKLSAARAIFDAFRVHVMEAKGEGIPDGITTLGQHEIRFAHLQDIQRAILLILRSDAHVFRLVVQERLSTQTLERALPLVIDAGDWKDLKNRAIELLQAWPEPNAEGGAGNEDGLGGEEDAPLFAAGNRDDDLEAA